MPIKMNYSVTVNEAASAATHGDVLTSFNTDYAVQCGLNQAVGLGLSFCRRYQSIGIDAEATVKGKPTGTGAADPIRALEAGELDEKVYAELDAPGKGLRQRISLANREASDLVGDLDADIAPDIA